MTSLILNNRKRTYQMFLGQVDDKLKETDSIVEAKLKEKLKHYTQKAPEDEVVVGGKAETQLVKREIVNFELGSLKRKNILR